MRRHRARRHQRRENGEAFGPAGCAARRNECGKREAVVERKRSCVDHSERSRGCGKEGRSSGKFETGRRKLQVPKAKSQAKDQIPTPKWKTAQNHVILRTERLTSRNRCGHSSSACRELSVILRMFDN